MNPNLMNHPNAPVKRAGVPLLLLLSALIAMPALVAQNSPAASGSSDMPSLGPTITIVGGDNQTGTPGAFNAQPFDVAVWNAAGTEPLVGTEVTFTVQAGGGLLASSKDASTLPSYTLTLKTDQDGTVRAYYQQPLVPGLLSQIKAATASDEILLLTRSLAPGDPTDSGSSSSDQSSKPGQETPDRSAAAVQSGVAVASGAVAASSSSTSPVAQTPAQPPKGHGPKLVIKTRKGMFSVDTATWAITASAQ